MPQFAANLSMLYPELDFLDRFEAAARDGFRAVEYLFPYPYERRELKARLQANGLHTRCARRKRCVVDQIARYDSRARSS